MLHDYIIEGSIRTVCISEEDHRNRQTLWHIYCRFNRRRQTSEVSVEPSQSPQLPPIPLILLYLLILIIHLLPSTVFSSSSPSSYPSLLLLFTSSVSPPPPHSKFMRTECLNNRFSYDEPLNISRLVNLVAQSLYISYLNMAICGMRVTVARCPTY